MFKYLFFFVLLQPLLSSCGNSICVALYGSKCQQEPTNNLSPGVTINSFPSPSPVVVAPIPPQPSVSNSPTPSPTKPQPSQREIKTKEAITSLTQNSYKNHRNIIKFISTSEGLKYQRIHGRRTITTDVCSIDNHEEMKIKISCSENNNVREVILDLNGNLDRLIVNFYKSNNFHITSKHVISKIKEKSVSERKTLEDEPL